MMQLYTTEQSLQSVHRSQLEHRLARVDVKQRTTRWIKDTLRGLVQHLKEAFASFFAAGRASPIAEAAPALLPDTDTDKTAPSSSASASSFLAGIVKPDADLDVWNLSKVDAKESTTDLDELESILADVNELFLQLTTEIYNAYTNLSNLQGHTLAGLLVDISAHESEQERDCEAIVNFLELLRATLGGLQQPELALALG
ncbi:hypothetical protein JCM8115_001672 [Rhodotorula mucilaginosa]|uniref:Uncharacterized protein n=1 Tax=Rhodotorula mucilaginosa TaxID=5537 RepID=A0A9P6W828_RHOMI|nr:hypothetical protein C6P46_002648 [Rhodotorula mucilaginosa]